MSSIRRQWPDYHSVAQRWGVGMCTWCNGGDHALGWSNPSRGVVHFQERKVSRAGLRRFLKLVASVLKSHNRGQPEWQRLFEQNEWAKSAAHQMGLRIPIHLSAYDRAKAARQTRDLKDLPTGFRRWAKTRD